MAFAGRTSTEDQQDPTLSIPRQLANSRAALPAHAIITAHFYDIESGRKSLALRGTGRGHEHMDIPVPRDGGITELLAEAASPDRRFDAVICESIDRIARRTYVGTLIENQLEQAGVVLLAADEPIMPNGKRATQILTRRVKQGVAEWYVLELLEKSWGGFEAHIGQGFNIGKPPYGYQAAKIPHPVPARRAEGATKHRLVPDPVCGPVVTQIFAWRIGERLSYKHLADRLNARLDRYPPPQPPDPARALGRWSGSAVRDILVNPKYTGYMVWNRRSTRAASGKVNPPDQWVWSDAQSHEPLVTRDAFIAAQQIAKTRERSRSEAGRNTHVQTKRSYPLRSFIFCAVCNRRMFGKTRRQTAYYTCLPAHGYRPDGHPPTIYVREDQLMDGITQFFASNIFGSARKARLRSALLQASEREVDGYAQGRRALQRAIEDLDVRRARLINTLEVTDDPTGDLARDVQERMTNLARQKADKVAQLRELNMAQPVRHAPDLLDALPEGVPSLDRLPEELLRELFDVFRLQVRYDKTTHTATCTVTLTGETVDIASTVSDEALQEPNGHLTVPVRVVPPVGFEPTHPAPEAGALSPELRGLDEC